MLQDEGEEWTVSKLRQLLGKHISAMEMANAEFSQMFTKPGCNPNISQNEYAARKGFSSNKPTASGLLAGNSRNNAPKQVQVKCIFCDQVHWSDECSNYLTLQER